MLLFREVEGFHNWMFYTYLEGLKEVEYVGYNSRGRYFFQNGERVSYILREGDLMKYHISFSSLLEGDVNKHKRQECRNLRETGNII